MKTKVLSLLLGAAICTSCFVLPVSAAENEETVYTFDGYVSETKNAAVPDKWVEVNGYSNNKAYNRVEIFSEKGTFGKKSDDTVYKIAPYWTSDNSPQSQWYQTRYKPNGDDGVSVVGSRYVKISYETAVNYMDATRWLQLMFKDSSSKSGETGQLFKIVKENGALVLYVGGEKSSYSVPAEKWMRFDAVLDMQTLTADLYVDGRLKKSDWSLGLKEGFTPASLAQYIFGVNVIKNDAGTAYNQSQTYFDNVSYMMTNEKPEISAYTAPDVLDFQSYTGGTPQAYNSYTKQYEDFVLVSPTTIQTFGAYSGLKGKDGSDVSLRIKADSGKEDNAPQNTQYRWVTNTDMAAGSNALYFKFSTEFAMEGSYINRRIYMQGSNQMATSGEKAEELPIIEICRENGEQVVRVAGEKTDLQLPMGVLMRLDVVVNREAKTFDLYINGEKKLANRTMAISWLGVIKQIQLRSHQIWSYTNTYEQVWSGALTNWNGYVASDTYYDNMECGKYYTYPEIEPYTSPTVAKLTAYNETVYPIDGAMRYVHWTSLGGYDSQYYYYAENVKLPADGATRAYKASFGGNVTTDNSIFEVKNGAVTAYGRELGSIAPTDREFKLSFMFDVLNKTYNAYIDDVPAVVEMPFETGTAAAISSFAGVELSVTAAETAAVVKSEPVAAGAYITVPKNAEYTQLSSKCTEGSAEVKILSNKLSGVPVLATYSGGRITGVALGESNQREISIEKTANDEVKFMLLNSTADMKPVIDFVDVK